VLLIILEGRGIQFIRGFKSSYNVDYSATLIQVELIASLFSLSHVNVEITLSFIDLYSPKYPVMIDSKKI